MIWLIAAVSAYFLFAVASLGDRYLLIGPPSPKIYAFYVGTLGITVLLLAPFVGFFIPDVSQIMFSFWTGAIFVLSLLVLYYGLEKFQVSRIIPAIGGFMPIFTLILAYFIISRENAFGWQGALPFGLLVAGSIFISLEKSFKFSLKALFFAAVPAFLLSLYFVLAKIGYSNLGFWPGFIWIRIGSFLTALLLMFFKDVRSEIFRKKASFTKKTGTIFIFNQVIGAGAVILQNWSLALVSAVHISFVSALQGIQYVFLFIITLLISFKNPAILKEKISRKIIFQKIAATALIGAGLAILAV